jgi:hypothetical protein
MVFKFDSHSCYVQTIALAERHRTFDAVLAHHGLIEQPGDSACQTMDTSLTAFGVEEEKPCICLQQEMMRNYGFGEDIKHIIRPNTMAFQHLIEVCLVHPETSSVVALCGLCGTNVVFPCATGVSYPPCMPD